MTVLPYSPESYDLIHQGVIALAEVESNGICVDEAYLHHALKRANKKIARMEAELKEDEVVRVWKRAFGQRANLQSDAQLGTVLFDHMKFKSVGSTATGRHKTSRSALETIDHPFVLRYLEIKRLKKANGTYLKGLLRETVNGRLHCFFNLHTVTTYRSSSEKMNFQNIPIREVKIQKLVRTALVPSKGRRLLELDFAGAEVRVSCCYHHDPRLIDYVLDPTKDMHRDMSMECFRIDSVDEVSKGIRGAVKGMFVFAEFYGNWYLDVARSLWAAVDSERLALKSGTPLRQHLTDLGLTDPGDFQAGEKPRRGTFEEHIMNVERDFWNVRFKVYNQWKKDWYAEYQRAGWFKTLTGFICQGYMKRNDVINYPVQGSSFHCLLWLLNRLVLTELRKHGMKSVVVGQIHDSIVFDAVPEEVDGLIALIQRLLAKKLPRAFPWLIVPMKAEVKVSEVNGNWAEMTEIKV